MAGQGPAPKAPEQRRRANAPAGGEWQELSVEPGEVPALPEPEGEGWHPNAARSWAAWFSDPAASMWTEADLDAVCALLALADEFWRGRVSVAAEMRLRAGELGLTQKGKRELRWRLPRTDEAPVVVKAAPASERRKKLRVV